MMKCKICGGSLKYSDRTYICENCGRSFPVSDYYENIETYICYVENDFAGRRTKDSIIAQEIYQLLSSNNINAFYARVSASDLSGDELEKANNTAIHNSKTVLLLGLQKQNFELLFDRYKDFFQGKVVIPVYMDMDAYDIPRGISSIQALDYGKVGASSDLVKGLLNTLGREQEVNFVTLSKDSTRKKKRVWIVAIASLILLAVLSAALFFVFHHFSANEPQTEEVDTKAIQYDEAIQCIDDGNYEMAMQLFSDLSGYKDSEKQLLTLYSKYAGYYKNEETSTTLHLQVLEGGTGSVEITKNTDSGAHCRLTETAQFQENRLVFSFNDSDNNHGEASLELKNTELCLSLVTTTQNSEVSMGSFDATFYLDQKSDKPFTEQLDAETILGFVKNRTTMSQLNQMGYELVFDGAVYKSTNESRYSIKNTDISFAIYTYDPVIASYETSESKVDEPFVVAVSAPANIIYDDIIGKTNTPFLKDDILYVPDGDFSLFGGLLGDPGHIELTDISSDTKICFTSRSLIGDKLFDELVQSYLVSGEVRRQYQHQYSITLSSAEIIEESGDFYIVRAESWFEEDPPATYKVNKNTYEIDEITEYTEKDEKVPENNYLFDNSEPNVFCPNCEYGFFVTGVGLDGLTCPQCNYNWLP